MGEEGREDVTTAMKNVTWPKIYLTQDNLILSLQN
jgi:hypothetical protein